MWVTGQNGHHPVPEALCPSRFSGCFALPSAVPNKALFVRKANANPTRAPDGNNILRGPWGRGRRWLF